MLVYGWFKLSFFKRSHSTKMCQKIYNAKNAEMSNWATIRDYKTQNFMPRASRMNLESYLLLFCVTHGTELTFFKNLC